jgi:hypothetical protein
MGTSPSKEEKEKEFSRKYGILIPPSFGVGVEPWFPPNNSSGADLSTFSGSPCIVKKLRHHMLSDRLLTEYMTPGVWLFSATSSSVGSVLASFSQMEASSSYIGTLLASQKVLHDKRNGERIITLQTTTDTLPSIIGDMKVGSGFVGVS